MEILILFADLSELTCEVVNDLLMARLFLSHRAGHLISAFHPFLVMDCCSPHQLVESLQGLVDVGIGILVDKVKVEALPDLAELAHGFRREVYSSVAIRVDSVLLDFRSVLKDNRDIVLLFERRF